ncbi:MAG: hypothetical protein GX591_14280, partial [Planctomycetes bacterium]|nr:hypothetical protein [Planctomycetota bacterium]
MSNRAKRKRIRRGRAVALAGGRPQAVEVQLVEAASTGAEPIPVTDGDGDLGGGTILNVAVMTIGTAWPRGRDPFEVDETTLSQLAAAINERTGGVVCRCTHPELQEGAFDGYVDPILWLVGRVRNARLVGAGESRQVRADVHLGTYADEGPNGRLGTRLKALARTAPADCGMSVRAGFVFEERGDLPPVGRVAWCSAVDFVGNPGANPEGLLSGGRTPTTNRGAGDGTPGQDKETEMKLNKQQRAYLV